MGNDITVVYRRHERSGCPQLELVLALHGPGFERGAAADDLPPCAGPANGDGSPGAPGPGACDEPWEGP
jgi:hypothetical protein